MTNEEYKEELLFYMLERLIELYDQFETSQASDELNLDFPEIVKNLNGDDFNPDKKNKLKTDLKVLFEALKYVIVQREQLNKDMNYAEKIQEFLIPRQPPQIPELDIASFFQPARMVSGDYFDFIPIANNRYGFTIADVSGKGLPGALIMSMLRSVLRLVSQQNPFPGLVLRDLTKALFKDLKPGIFITIVYMIFDTNTKLVTLSSAGHNPVIHFNHKQSKINLIKPEGVGIGVGDESFFQKHLYEEKLQMSSGDILFLYTDGLVEAMNIKEEEFGVDRLKELIKRNSLRSSQEIIDVVMKEVRDFIGKAILKDDITIVSLKFE